jgi:hypothetical protein
MSDNNDTFRYIQHHSLNTATRYYGNATNDCDLQSGHGQEVQDSHDLGNACIARRQRSDQAAVEHSLDVSRKLLTQLVVFDVLSCRLSLRAIASGTNLRSVGNETWGVFALRADRWLSSEKLVETPFLENQQVLAHKEA